MARIPDASALGGRPVPQAGGGIAQYRVQEDGVAPIVAGAGAALQGAGRTIAATGQTLDAAGEEMWRAVKIEEEKINAVRAEEAFNRLRERQIDLTVGEKDGFANVRGGDAVARPLFKDYTERFGAEAKAIEDSLANDDQRQKFRLRAGVAGLQFKENLLQHVQRQSLVHAEQVFEGTVKTEVRAASAEWNNPNAVATSIYRIDQAVKAQAETAGWAPEFAEAKRQAAVGAVHQTVIQQALASGDWKFAQAYFQTPEVRADVDPATAKLVEKAIEDQTQKIIANGYREAFIGSRNDVKALDGLIVAVSADKTLDDTRRLSLVQTFTARSEALKRDIERRQMAAERAADRAQGQRERQIERGLNDIMANIRQGYEPTAQQMEPYLAAAKGSPFLEAQVRQTIRFAEVTRAFRTTTPLEQEAMISRAEQQLREDPTKVDRTLLDSWKQIRSAQREAVKLDPVTFAVRQGFVDTTTPAGAPLDLTDPAKAAGQLSARLDLARQMQGQYGAPLKPLTAPEKDLLVAALGRASPERKVEYFGALRTALGGDSRGYMAIMAQIAPDDPVTAIAGSQAGSGRQATAALIARGQGYLNPPKGEDGKPVGGKLIALPPDQEFEREFALRTKDAFGGRQQARSDHLQAVKAVYAALASDKGGETALKTVDAGLFKKAFESVLGQAETINSKTVILPYGMGVADFKNGLRQRITQLVDEGRVDPKEVTRLADLPLVNRGDGRYVMQAGDAVVVDKTGAPIVLDFTRTPYTTSGGNVPPPPPTNDGVNLPLPGKTEKKAGRRPVSAATLGAPQ